MDLQMILLIILLFIFIIINDFIIAFQRSYCKQEFCIYLSREDSIANLSQWESNLRLR